MFYIKNRIVFIKLQVKVLEILSDKEEIEKLHIQLSQNLFKINNIIKIY